MAYIRGKFYVYANEAGLLISSQGETVAFESGDPDSRKAAIAMREALKDFLKAEGVSDVRIDS